MLAEGGARPLVIERSSGPHDIVCGGFLGQDALAALTRLGVDAATLGAHPITRVRLIAGDRVAEAALPFAAAGLSRRTLDEALRTRAAASGAAIERGVAIRRVDPDSRTLTLADRAEIAGEALFLASGKHELRGGARPVSGEAIGLRQRLGPHPALTRALAGTIELHLLRDGYAGLLALEDGSVNLCLSVSAARLAAAGGPDALADELAREAPRLGERLAHGAGAWLAIAGVPYGWRSTAAAPKLFRLGDQAAVIASLAGDGVAIALASGTAAARAWLREGPAGAIAYQQRFAAQARRPLAVAGGLKAMAERPAIAPVMVRLMAQVPGAARLLARATRIA